MVPNPFVELARDPVGVVAGAGYLLLLLGLVLGGVTYAVRTLIEDVWMHWLQNKDRQNAEPGEGWARLYGEGPGYIPPTGKALQAMFALFVLSAVAWAVSALLWFLGITGV